MALFESYERRIAQINKFLKDNGIASIEEAEKITKAKGLDIVQRVRDIQPICFENACWAYLVGAAVAIRRGQTVASEIAKTLGEGLQSFCIPGSVADDRKVGLGHGNLASMLWRPSPRVLAISLATVWPRLMATAAPTRYAQQAFSKQMGWMSRTR